MTLMQTPPRLVDPTALRRNRQRADRAPALFLLEAVADEIEERLQEVNRSFTAPAIVTGWPEFWRARYPTATIVPDDDLLDLMPETYDLVLHPMNLHWASDPVGQLVQSRRALQPDGLFLGALFGGQTLHQLRAALAEAEVRTTGGLSPRVAPMAEIRDLGGLLQRAGFALPVADGTPYTVTYGTAFDLMHDLRAMGEGNALADRLRQPTRRAVMTEATAIYATTFGMTDGRIPATFEVITLTGWAPAETQQKPLRPGSATHRLADALGVPEKPATPRRD